MNDAHRALPPEAGADSASLGLSSSLLRSFNIPDARSSVRRSVAQGLNLIADRGLVSRQIPCQLHKLGGEQTSHRENEREREQNHAHDAIPCATRMRCNNPTSGASTKLRSIAIAIGMNISRPK
jgi:hypothetical protein